MTTYYHKINEKIADAVAAVLASLGGSDLTGVTVFKSGSMTTLSVPRIEILSDAEAEQFGATITGNYTAAVRVRVICSTADTSRATHNATVAVVGDALFRDDFVTQVTTAAITNFTMDWWYPKGVRETIEGDEFITEFTAEAHCMPS